MLDSSHIYYALQYFFVTERLNFSPIAGLNLSKFTIISKHIIWLEHYEKQNLMSTDGHSECWHT